ncbi:helix-turn-helix domain-containing protein [Saccharicrinis sp. 156]|uniref:helix-turn-helix domain-containing protein n=1 Tax=Saccharicrinis sp. 156 TaxID=3417574 RepID=UPI003D355DC9
MKSAEFGAFVKAIREEKGLPQRKVAHAIDVDTSTLSKMELGDRQISITMVKPLAEILEHDFKDLQIRYIAEKIKTDFKEQPFLKEALEMVIETSFTK